MTKKAQRAFETFVEEIPDDKLQPPFSDAYKTIYTNKHFRLDMQGKTAEGWNLQIQANLQSTEKQVRELSPNTVSQLTVPSSGDAGWAVEEIRAKFLRNSEFEKPGGPDIDSLSRRSNRSSLQSFRETKVKVATRVRNTMRDFKSRFRHEDS
ncbi:hypothetical protein DFP73DRAFT_539876 [Morchella snyderi]|nr:hypothetical protein DFP73DRAFT_539876 [Morchella snyderi]